MGVPLALSSARVAANIVGEMTASSAWSMAIAAVGTIVVALLAAYVPARRATQVDPITALRAE